MSPMTDNTWTWFIPIVPPPARKVVPMEGLIIEFTHRPLRHPSKYIALCYRVFRCILAERRHWKFVREILVRPNSHDKNAATALRNTVTLSVQDVPFHVVTRQPVSAQLIVQKLAIVPIGHTVHILDDERPRAN